MLEVFILFCLGLLLLLPPQVFLISGESQLMSFYRYGIPIEDENAIRLKRIVERKGGLLLLALILYLPYLGLPLFALIVFSDAVNLYLFPALLFAGFLIYAQNTGTILAFLIKLKQAKSTSQEPA